MRELGQEAVLVRDAAALSRVDGLVIPGGESTVMSRLCDRYGLWEPLHQAAAAGMPMLGTCAGMIFLAREIQGAAATFAQRTLGLLDICVARNAYGAQQESFETDVDVPALKASVRGVFIRAPRVVSWSPDVEVLASYGESPVIVRQNAVWAVAFHPEIVGEKRVHAMWLEQARASPVRFSVGVVSQ